MYSPDTIYKCKRCGYETANPDRTYYPDMLICPACECEVLDIYYTCPGCGKTKPEYDCMIDDIDLCRQCFKEVADEVRERHDNPKWKELIKYMEDMR